MIPTLAITIGDTRLDLLDGQQLLDTVSHRLTSPSRPLVLASSNLDHVHHFGYGGHHRDPARGATDAEWLVTVDGRPIMWAARWLTGRRWPQLAGSDLLPELLAVAHRLKVTVGFLGGWPDQHDRLGAVLADRFPGLDVTGYWSPSRDDLADVQRAEELAREVAAAGVDLLVVGLGKPRQELWLSAHLAASNVKVALAFGAAANFLTREVPRAPAAWRRAGMEWLYRLLHEPRRLWRRYLLQGPVAIWRIFRWSRSSTS